MIGIPFIQDLAVLLLVAGIAGWLFQRIGLSNVVGYLVAGMLVGPASGLLPLVEETENIQTLSQIGLVFLMFSIGMGISLRRLRRLGLSIVVATGIGALIVFNSTRLLAVAFGMTEIQGLFLAAMLVVSSSAVIRKSLKHLGFTHRKSGQLALGVTALEDIVAILVLTFLISYAGSESTAMPFIKTLGFLTGFVIFLSITGFLLVPRYLTFLSRKASGELQTLLITALLFLLSLLAYHAGYSLALGAFLLGAIVAETPQRIQVERSFESFRFLFSSVFFASIGMMIDIRSLFEIWPLILLISVMTIVGRAAVTTASLVLTGNATRESVRAGLALTPIGEFSFIIAQAGISAAVLPKGFYPLAVGISVITSLVAPILVRNSLKISQVLLEVEPKVVSNGIALYHRWLTQVGALGTESRFWKISRRRFVQIGIGLLFVTGLLIVANPAYSWLSKAIGPDWVFPHGTVILFWGGMGILVLAPLLAVWRNISALALIYAQMTSRGKQRDTIAPMVVEYGIKSGSGLLLTLWIAGLLPLGTTGVWSLLLVLALVLLTLLFFRRRMIYLHSRFEIELEELLGTDEPVTAPLPTWLTQYRDWELNISDYELPDYAACAGRKIGDLALRRTFGCSIIAIDRHGFFIGNPGPETALFPRDRLLLLGKEDQIEAARQLLSVERTTVSDGLVLDEVQMERLTVPPESPRLNQTLGELNIARDTGVQVAAIKRRGEPRVNPGANVRLKAKDELLVVGTVEQVREFQRWLELPLTDVEVKEEEEKAPF